MEQDSNAAAAEILDEVDLKRLSKTAGVHVEEDCDCDCDCSEED
jgi:hypothetical protein